MTSLEYFIWICLNVLMKGSAALLSFSPVSSCFSFNESKPAMKSERSIWRPLFRTTEKWWPLKILHRRSSPPLLVIQWVEQVRNDQHRTSVFLFLPFIPFVLLTLLLPVMNFPLSSFFFLNTVHISLSSFTTHLSAPSPPLFPLHSPHSSSSPTLTDEYQTIDLVSSRGPTDFKHTAFSTSSSLTLLCSSPLFSNCIFPCNYFRMNISSLLNGRIFVSVCSSSAQSLTLKRFDRPTAACRCQHSLLSVHDE